MYFHLYCAVDCLNLNIFKHFYAYIAQMIYVQGRTNKRVIDYELSEVVSET